MRTGIAAWHADVMARGGARRGVALLTLTYAGTPEDADYGNTIRAFWDAYRHRFGAKLYFSWVELQRRGVLHYHAMIVDAPTVADGHTAEALRGMWKHGRIDVQWRKRGWLAQEGGKYATGYAKKAGQKRYQQEWDRVPSTVRTFQCSRIRTAPGRVERLVSWVRWWAEAGGWHLLDGRRDVSAGGWTVEVARDGSNCRYGARLTVEHKYFASAAGPPTIRLGPVHERLRPLWQD